MEGIVVAKHLIRVVQKNKWEFLCLTDIARQKGYDTGVVISNWLNTRRAIIYMGLWEGLYNPLFNHINFYRIKQNRTDPPRLSVKKWLRQTQAIGLEARPGRYGGTFAVTEIALEFAEWFGPEFRAHLGASLKAQKEFLASLRGHY